MSDALGHIPIVRAALLLWCLVTADPAVANPAEIARDIADQIGQARQVLQSAEGERDTLKAFAKVVKAYDHALAASWVGIDALARAENEAVENSRAAQARVNAVALALMRLETLPPALRFGHPAGAQAAATTRSLLRTVQPKAIADLDQQISALNEATTLRLLNDAAREDMKTALSEVKAARTRLLAAADARREPTRSEIARQADALAQTASTLNGLAQSLAALGWHDAQIPDGQLLPGSLQPPVEGEITTDFQEPATDGVIRDGIVLVAPANALVVAPGTATVAYAGPFLNRGEVVVLRFGASALLALNGLFGVAVSTGDLVQSGDPVGFLGASATGDEEILIDNRASDSAFRIEPLYIELRIDGIATDPAPYFDFGHGQER